MDSNVVILEHDNYDHDNYDIEPLTAKLDRGIALLGGWEQFIRPGMMVLL